MVSIKQLDLLREVENRHPDGVIKGRNDTFITLVDLGNRSFRTQEMLKLFLEYWKPLKDGDLYVINLKNIDILSPSAARVLVESATNFASQYKLPILFTNVKAEVMEGLESQANSCDPSRIMWVIDDNNNTRLLGKVSNKLRELLDLLEEKGSGDARSLAASIENETSKKAVGNLSVYLQKLFSAGLVGREKVTAIDREDAERGWTYNYITAPTLKKNSTSNSILIYP